VTDPVRSVHTAYAQRIVFGPQTVDDVATAVREVGARRVLVITSPRLASSDGGKRIVQRLGRVVAGVFDGAQPHVPTPVVQAAVRAAREAGMDGVVSFGGGSCADLAKAVCWFVEREAGTPGASFVDRPAIAHISVATTYSGASLTPYFAMTDPSTRRKTGGGGPTLTPLAVILDPVQTLDLDPVTSAETGMAALAHGVEVAWSPGRSPEAEVLALACVREVAAALPAVVDDPFDIDARTRMLRASLLGGRALQNAPVGAEHGLVQLAGGRTGAAHGRLHAMLLPAVIRYNRDAVPDELERIGDALGDPEDPAGAVERLRERVGISGSLADCRVTLDDLDAIARMSGGNPSVGANPKPVTEDDAREILSAAY
jgi:maleylacetate reductase